MYNDHFVESQQYYHKKVEPYVMVTRVCRVITKTQNFAKLKFSLIKGGAVCHNEPRIA